MSGVGNTRVTRVERAALFPKIICMSITALRSVRWGSFDSSSSEAVFPRIIHRFRGKCWYFRRIRFVSAQVSSRLAERVSWASGCRRAGRGCTRPARCRAARAWARDTGRRRRAWRPWPAWARAPAAPSAARICWTWWGPEARQGAAASANLK